MRFLKIIAGIVLVSLLSLSCSKDTIYASSGDEVAKELQTAIGKGHVDRVYALKDSEGFPSEFSSVSGAGWTFANGFINITNGTASPSYNLSYLRRYLVTSVTLDNQSSAIALLLYF